MIKLTNVLYVYSPYCKIRFSFFLFFLRQLLLKSESLEK